MKGKIVIFTRSKIWAYCSLRSPRLTIFRPFACGFVAKEFDADKPRKTKLPEGKRRMPHSNLEIENGNSFVFAVKTYFLLS